jgi:hypothetical protein
MLIFFSLLASSPESFDQETDVERETREHLCRWKSIRNDVALLLQMEKEGERLVVFFRHTFQFFHLRFIDWNSSIFRSTEIGHKSIAELFW